MSPEKAMQRNQEHQDLALLRQKAWLTAGAGMSASEARNRFKPVLLAPTP